MADQPGYSVARPGHPAEQAGHPIAQPRYSAEQPGYPVAQPGYSADQPGHPVERPDFPADQPGYPVHEPGYSADQPGHPVEPEPIDATIFDLRIPSGLIADMPVSGLPLASPAPEAPPTGPVLSYPLRVNGAAHVVESVWIGESLLHVLRERLGLSGAKEGCGQGVCGACTVLVDGVPAVSCLVPAATVGEREVVTVEGLAEHGVPTAVQRALIAHGAVQCGFCVPGVVVSAHALLSRKPRADEATVRRALAGHPCRCAGPNRMIAAVRSVAAAEEAAEPPASLFEPAGSGEESG